MTRAARNATVIDTAFTDVDGDVAAVYAPVAPTAVRALVKLVDRTRLFAGFPVDAFVRTCDNPAGDGAASAASVDCA